MTPTPNQAYTVHMDNIKERHMTTADKVQAIIDRTDLTVNGVAQSAHIPRSTFVRRLATDDGWLVAEVLALASVLGVPAVSLLPDGFVNSLPETRGAK